jgi:hypothetical protein
MQASAARQANTAGLIGGLASIGGNYLTGLASQQANPYTESRDMATALGTGGLQQVDIQPLSNTPVPTIDTSYTPSWAR